MFSFLYAFKSVFWKLRLLRCWENYPSLSENRVDVIFLSVQLHLPSAALVFVACGSVKGDDTQKGWKTVLSCDWSYEEFLAQTQKPEFEKDPGWEGLDEQQIYTQDEYREFEMKRQEEIQRLIAQGVVSYLICYNRMPCSALCLLQCTLLQVYVITVL